MVVLAGARTSQVVEEWEEERQTLLTIVDRECKVAKLEEGVKELQTVQAAVEPSVVVLREPSVVVAAAVVVVGHRAAEVEVELSVRRIVVVVVVLVLVPGMDPNKALEPWRKSTNHPLLLEPCTGSKKLLQVVPLK